MGVMILRFVMKDDLEDDIDFGSYEDEQKPTFGEIRF